MLQVGVMVIGLSETIVIINLVFCCLGVNN